MSLVAVTHRSPAIATPRDALDPSATTSSLFPRQLPTAVPTRATGRCGRSRRISRSASGHGGT